jgi:hypothetical protein
MGALGTRSRLGPTILAGVLLSYSSAAFAIDDVLLRHIETVLDFVGVTAASCALHYNDQIKPEPRAKLNFSPEEIGAYCVCSTKLLIRQMDEKDFQTSKQDAICQRRSIRR